MALRAAEGNEAALVARAFSRPCRHSCRHVFNRVFKGAVFIVLLRGRDEFPDPGGDLIAHPGEDSVPLLMAALCGGRIFKAPVQLRSRAWEYRARLPGRVADGDHPVERLAEEFIQTLRAMGGDVDADIAHRLDSVRIQPDWLRAGARGLESISGHVTQQSLRHLAATGVAGTQEQDSGSHDFSHRKATFTSEISTGTSTNGPMTAAKAAPLPIPNVAMATAMASSKLLDAAVKESVVASG